GEVAAPPDRFKSEDFDIFRSRPDTGTGTGGGEGGRPGLSGARPGGGNTEGPGAGGTEGHGELPEDCPVRLLDVSVQPAKSSEYRLQVVMANPNYDRKDVASPTYQVARELASEWSKMPIRVHVDPELHYYAIDQGAAGAKPEHPDKKHRAPFHNVNI